MEALTVSVRWLLAAKIVETLRNVSAAGPLEFLITILVVREHQNNRQGGSTGMQYRQGEIYISLLVGPLNNIFELNFSAGGVLEFQMTVFAIL